MSKKKIPERNKRYKLGLLDMIKWIDAHSEKPVRMMKIIEVGSWTGCGSEIFAKYFKKVICIDPWENNIGGITDLYNMKDVEDIFDERLKKYPGVIFKNKMSSEEAAKVYNDKSNMDQDFLPDVVYIDANHEYKHAKKDIKLWKKVPNLFLCGHDFENRFPGVKKAVIELLGYPHKIFQDSSWIFKL